MQTAISRLTEANDQLNTASEKIWKLKDQALLWVYVTEWLVVSGVGLICGFFLWSVMIRRKLYKEVTVSRLSRIHET